MPMPNFMRHVNKRTFNRLELAQGKRPVLHHVGRASGTAYRTPLEAIPVDGGYAFILVYGADSTDWVKNVRAAGEATLQVHGTQVQLTDPQILTGEDGWAILPPEQKRLPKFMNVTEIMRMDLTSA